MDQLHRADKLTHVVASRQARQSLLAVYAPARPLSNLQHGVTVIMQSSRSGLLLETRMVGLTALGVFAPHAHRPSSYLRRRSTKQSPQSTSLMTQGSQHNPVCIKPDKSHHAHQTSSGSTLNSSPRSLNVSLLTSLLSVLRISNASSPSP